MFDKINPSNKTLNVSMNNINNNGKKYLSHELKSDEFVKNTKEDDDMQTYTKEDIAYILANYSIDKIVSDLINKGYSSSGCAIAFSENNTPCILMGIENVDTSETEQYTFTYSEFAQIIRNAIDKQIELFPKTEKENLETQYIKLIDRLKQNDKNI